MTLQIEYAKRIPVREEVDVLVVGGGPAGVAAAVSAARRGAKTLLVEGQGAFGGMGTLGLVPALGGMGDGVRTLSGGIGVEVARRLEGRDPRVHSPEEGSLASVPVDAENLKRVYDDMVEESGAEFLFFTTLVDVVREGERADVAVLSAKSGLFGVKARLMVDATGDGDLCARAGAAFDKGDADGLMMPGTLCSQWSGIDWYAARASGQALFDEIVQALADGLFTQDDYHCTGIWRTGPDAGGGNMGHLFGVDNTDERSVSTVMVLGRRLALEYGRFFETRMKGFEKLRMTQTAPLPGIRETRRVLGDYVLSVDDFHRRAVFDDEIGRCHYPVDIHPCHPGREEYDRFLEEFRGEFRYEPGESYGIPYRCLLARGLENVYAVGRCVSADRRMIGSVRITGACFLTGMAAGMAAAMAAGGDGRTRGVDVSALRERLREARVYLR